MILLTRPYKDSEIIAKELQKYGIESFIAPLFEIEFITDTSFKPETFDAFIFTSQNGVQAYFQHSDLIDKQVFAVGPTTASLAKKLGFQQILKSNGDVTTLIKTIIDNISNRTQKLLHITGEENIGDLAATLNTKGLNCTKILLYKKRYVSSLPYETIDKLSCNALTGVIFLSPNTVSTFNQLIEKHELYHHFKSSTAFCISKNTADKLISKWWKHISVSKRPDQLSLITSIVENNIDYTLNSSQNNKETVTMA